MKQAISLPAAALVAAVAFSSASWAQASGGFEKKAYNYNEWAKGRFSEVVTVTNPGKWIFLGGIGPENEGDGKILHPGDFYQQCKYAFLKINKLLGMHGASLKDVVRMTVYMTDIRFFPDWGKCRGEEFKDVGADLPASTLLNVQQLAWPYMMVEVDVTAVLAK
jgi:enamine deaminase RidA (YjgF/YER057c/UK114 family)